MATFFDFTSPTIDLEMSQPLSEDDIYRTSTQYRLWSFSPEALATLRKRTHDLAIERARRYAGERVVQNGDVAMNGANQQNGDIDLERIDCLTEEEELRLVQRYCDQIRTTSDHFKWPVNVKVYPLGTLSTLYLMLTIFSGDCSTVPQALLPLQFLHDVPTERDLQDCPLPCL